MKKKELLAKIEELERRIAALEARPVYPVYPAPLPSDWSKQNGYRVPWLPDTICGDGTVPGKLRPGEIRITCQS